MKLLTHVLFSLIAGVCYGQLDGTNQFFPSFSAYSNLPVITYGEGFVGASWNDPHVIKVNDNYIMYASAGTGITGETPVKVYRWESPDGYSWTLNPATAIVEPQAGTHYQGGTETPSVVYYKNQYHLYLTTYPASHSDVGSYTISHAVSSDGISWVMDTNPVLSSDGSPTWNGTIAAEPGAVIVNDSLYLFYTAAGVQDNNASQSVALVKSSDGTNFTSPTQEVRIPRTLYPEVDNWHGLSTPSAVLLGDTILLYTDVAQNINGKWTQVALHQFKKALNEEDWYYSPQSIHHKDDFSWTNGNYLSEIRSICGLYDNGKYRIWYAGNHVGDIVGTDTTYNVEVINSVVHVKPDFWGIGTSEYSPTIVGVQQVSTLNIWQDGRQVYFSKPVVKGRWMLSSMDGKYSEGTISEGENSMSFQELPNGIYLFSLFQGGNVSTQKLIFCD